MEFDKLLATDIEQIIGYDNIKELDKENDKKLFKNFPQDWGKDRVVSLKKRDTPVKSQWKGTCSSFAVIAAIENKLQGKFELSERCLWDEYGKFSTKLALCSASSHYILEEKYWPQSQNLLRNEFEHYGRFRIKQYLYLKRDYLKVLEAIDRGNPCVVGLSTPKDLKKGYKQVEATSKVSRRMGHAMCVSGYKVENGKCYFLVKNSWGIKNGDEGYQYVSFDLYKTQWKIYCVFWEIKDIDERAIEKSNINDEELREFWDFN